MNKGDVGLTALRGGGVIHTSIFCAGACPSHQGLRDRVHPKTITSPLRGLAGTWFINSSFSFSSIKEKAGTEWTQPLKILLPKMWLFIWQPWALDRLVTHLGQLFHARLQYPLGPSHVTGPQTHTFSTLPVSPPANAQASKAKTGRWLTVREIAWCQPLLIVTFGLEQLLIVFLIF